MMIFASWSLQLGTVGPNDAYRSKGCLGKYVDAPQEHDLLDKCLPEVSMHHRYPI